MDDKHTRALQIRNYVKCQGMESWTVRTNYLFKDIIIEKIPLRFSLRMIRKSSRSDVDQSNISMNYN